MDGLTQLLKNGLSPAEAVDYYFTEIKDWSQNQWAKERDVNQQSVSQNVRQAKAKLR